MQIGDVDFDTAATDDYNFVFAGVADPDDVVHRVDQATGAAAAGATASARRSSRRPAFPERLNASRLQAPAGPNDPHAASAPTPRPASRVSSFGPAIAAECWTPKPPPAGLGCGRVARYAAAAQCRRPRAGRRRGRSSPR